MYKKKSADIATSTNNQAINALNAYFGRVLNQNEKVQKLTRPKKLRRLPNVLSEEEVQRLIQAVENPKHKCMLLLIYSLPAPGPGFFPKNPKPAGRVGFVKNFVLLKERRQRAQANPSPIKT